MEKRIWITWETQRRSIELAKKLKCTLYVIEYSGIFRYPISILKTLYILLFNQPDILFIQNPSMILTSLVCAYKFIVKIPVVVDRHTTFRINKPKSDTIRNKIFMKLNSFTIKYADLTIVTNKNLANIIHKADGNSFILPDMLPILKQKNKMRLKGKFTVVLISSFGEDEPIHEVIAAMNKFENEDTYLYITGNYKKLDSELPNKSSSNVIFTGFISEQEYVDLLYSADAAMVLTDADFCMLCGCYEAISVKKPLITSNKDVLKSYFSNAIFVDNSEKDISSAISEVKANYHEYCKKISDQKTEISLYWNNQYSQFEEALKTLTNNF